MKQSHIVVLVFLILLSGCANAPTSKVASAPTLSQPTASPIPTNTVEPTSTPTPRPTDTPQPTNTPQPTDTPRPTNTVEPTWTPQPSNTPTPISQQFNEVVMEQFDAAASSRNWYIVNDDVMGGVSTSSAAMIEPGIMVFTGTVSLENNGGFASVRSVQGNWNTAGTGGVRIRVMGDGKTYRFGINTDQTYADYDALFTTVAGQWQEFVLRYDQFESDYRGVPVDAPPIDPARITSIGFTIRDYQAGQFWLTVDWVRGIAPDL